MENGTQVRITDAYHGSDREVVAGRIGYVRTVRDDDDLVVVEVPSLGDTLWLFAPAELEVTQDAPAIPAAADDQLPARTGVAGGGRKDQGARFDLIPVLPMWHVANLYTAGAQKYAARNWEDGFDWSKSYAALQRHAQRFWMGEDNDPETGQPHMAAVAFHAFALMEFAATHPELDDRPKLGGQVPLAQIKAAVIREA